MTLRRIASGTTFEDLAAYSRAVVDDQYVYISGTVGGDPETKVIPADTSDQMRNIFRIIEPILADAGSGLDQVVRCRLYLTDIAHLGAAAAVLKEKFDKNRPANTTLICGIPAAGANVELEITARRSAVSG
jgi:enamine deaminase RidA (YjgF/YER057c/UK114 family)